MLEPGAPPSDILMDEILAAVAPRPVYVVVSGFEARERMGSLPRLALRYETSHATVFELSSQKKSVAGAAAARLPNVLLYIVDTLRADSLGAYGNKRIDTPAIDRLAREGVLFESMFANSSWTRPSIATILTGLYPTQHGTQGRDARLSPDVTTLADRLSTAGYTSAFATANPNTGTYFGFDRRSSTLLEFYEPTATGAGGHELITASDRMTEEAIQWLESAPEPFFLTVLTIDPHTPYAPPDRFVLPMLRENLAISIENRLLRIDHQPIEIKNQRSQSHISPPYAEAFHTYSLSQAQPRKL